MGTKEENIPSKDSFKEIQRKEEPWQMWPDA